jgi:hypothetical protein
LCPYDVVGQEKRYREIISDNDGIGASVSKNKSMVALKRGRIERARQGLHREPALDRRWILSFRIVRPST